MSEQELKWQVHEILLKDWDPLGVKDKPSAQNEYDSSVNQLVQLLQDDVTEEQLTEELNMLARENYGCSELESIAEQTKQAIQKLLELQS